MTKNRFKDLGLLILLMGLLTAGCQGPVDEGPIDVPEESAQVKVEEEAPEEEVTPEKPATREEEPEGPLEESDTESSDEKVEPEKEEIHQEEEDDEESPPVTEEKEADETEEKESPPPATEEPAVEVPDEPAAEEEEVEKKGPHLSIEGKVASPQALALEELKSLTAYSYAGDYYWLNSFGSKGHSHFEGIKLWPLLEEVAGIDPGAQQVKIIATDGYEMTFSVGQIEKQDYIDETDGTIKLPVIIAWREDGKDYDAEEAPPFKLIMGQKEAGDVNKPQWVSMIDRILVE